jgi:hypothetical protein
MPDMRNILGLTMPTLFANGLMNPKPKAAAPAKPASGGGQDPISRRSTAESMMNPSFAQMATALAKANGGQISLRQLGALSDVAYKTSPRQSVKSPTYKDVAANELMIRAQEQFAANQGLAQQALDVGDPRGMELGESAVREYMPTLRDILGAKVDPLGMPPVSDEEY